MYYPHVVRGEGPGVAAAARLPAGGGYAGTDLRGARLYHTPRSYLGAVRGVRDTACQSAPVSNRTGYRARCWPRSRTHAFLLEVGTGNRGLTAEQQRGKRNQSACGRHKRGGALVRRAVVSLCIT